MPNTPSLTKLKYEQELDPNFAAEVAAGIGGDKLFSCIQCGTCSGGCPVSQYMDYAPRKIIAMTRAGFKKEVLTSNTIWLCASCYNCTAECPKQIKITDVMYALKRRAIEEGVHPRRFAIPVLGRNFFNIVARYGRSHESELLVRMYLGTNPFKLLKQTFLGLGLFLRGRMGILPEKIKGLGNKKGSLQLILRALDQKRSQVTK